MTDDLIKLAARCAAAAGPDRELDKQIGAYMASMGSFSCWGCDDPLRFTASIDAAMTLVPEGLILRRLWSTKHVPHCVEISAGPDIGGWVSECDNSFALAICAAALRAKKGSTSES